MIAEDGGRPVAFGCAPTRGIEAIQRELATNGVTQNPPKSNVEVSTKLGQLQTKSSMKHGAVSKAAEAQRCPHFQQGERFIWSFSRSQNSAQRVDRNVRGRAHASELRVC